MDYSKIFPIRSVRTEEFKELEFRLSNYTVYSYVSSISDAGYSYSQSYYIEFQNSKGIGIYKSFCKEVWLAIKNYLLIGSSVKCDGLFHFDENGNLYYVEIKTIRYKDILLLNNELITPEGRVKISRHLFDDKVIISLLCGFVGFGVLASIITVYFVLLLLIDVIALCIYVSIKNKRMGREIEYNLEKIGLKKTKQGYITVENNKYKLKAR